MLNRAEIEQLLLQIPVGYKPADDAFLKAANQSLTAYRKLGVITHKDEEEVENKSQQIDCNAPGCQLAFPSVADYQAHFNNQHRFLCGECKRNLPTAHLLDLHITERHDHYFAACLERGTHPMFRCLVEQCDKRLPSPEERKDHCITVHKFPANFRYDQISIKSDVAKRTPGTHTPMEQDISSAVEGKTKPLRLISFGHQREKTFHTGSNSKKDKQAPVSAVEQMDDLQQAINEVLP